MQQPKSYAAAWNGKTFALVATGIGARAQHQSQIHRRVFDPEIEGSDLQVNFNMQQPKLYIITWNGKAFCRKLRPNIEMERKFMRARQQSRVDMLRNIFQIITKKKMLMKVCKKYDLRKHLLTRNLHSRTKRLLKHYERKLVCKNHVKCL